MYLFGLLPKHKRENQAKSIPPPKAYPYQTHITTRKHFIFDINLIKTVSSKLKI
jgi:hypothetical protein